MQWDRVSFEGPPIDDPELLGLLPPELADLLRAGNGFILFAGGLHVRGACHAPAWHSLRRAWLGPDPWKNRYPGLDPADIPFAEDAVGDQFLLRSGEVWLLSAETGDVSPLGADLGEFLRRAGEDPLSFLALHPLQQFREEGGELAPGQLLSVYPPFCTHESNQGISVRAIPAAERHRFLADLSAQIRDLPDGSAIRVVVDNQP